MGSACIVLVDGALCTLHHVGIKLPAATTALYIMACRLVVIPFSIAHWFLAVSAMYVQGALGAPGACVLGPRCPPLHTQPH